MQRNDMDYLHASARIAALENRIITEEELLKAAGDDSAQMLIRLLSERHVQGAREPSEYEKALEEHMAEIYLLVEEITGEQGLTDLFRYPIDGHNLKVMVKSKLAEGEFTGLYKMGGTVAVESLQRELDDKRFEAIPHFLGKTGLEAIDELAKTGDPQMVDRRIDGAVLFWMRQKADEIDCRMPSEYVRIRIDLVNFQSALRWVRIGADVQGSFGVFSEGGSCPARLLEQACGEGYDGLKEAAGHMAQGAWKNGLCEAVDAVKEKGSFAAFEAQEGRCFRELFETARFIPFGIDPVMAFLYRKEREIRACRMVLASKRMGRSGKQIEERVRWIYGS